MSDIRECIPETRPKPKTQSNPSQLPTVGHRVVQLGATYFNTTIRDIDARWIRVETDGSVQVKINGALVLDSLLPVPVGERIIFPDTTNNTPMFQAPIAFEFSGAVNSLEFTLLDPTGVDLRSLIHVYYSTDEKVRVFPGRPHHYVYEVTKTAGWGPITRVTITDLCLNSFEGPAPADSVYPLEIEVLGMGIENPIAFAGFDVTRQAIIWRDAADANTIREFCRVSQNIGGATNQSFHTDFSTPIRIPYVALAQPIAGAPLLPALQMELRHNGAGVFPEDLIAYFNYRVV